MRKPRNLKAITAMLLIGALLAGSLSGCSLFETKKKMKSSSDSDSDSDRELIWPFATTEASEPDTTEFDPGETEPSEAVTTEPTEVETVEPTSEPEPTQTEPTTTAYKQYFPDEIIHPMTGSGEITASVLNIREYPGMDYEVLGGLERGTRVVIYDQVMVDGEYWGEIYQGWINMQWVAMDGDVVGTWYQPLGMDSATGEDLYGFWTLELTGEFCYVVYGFGMDQVRQISRSGGTFQMDEYRISFDFTYGTGNITLAGITTAIPGNITCYWDVYGKTMTVKDAAKSVLTRGSVEKLREQLQEED